MCIHWSKVLNIGASVSKISVQWCSMINVMRCHESLLVSTAPGYAQFAAAVVQRVICDWWHAQGQKVVVGWSPMCGWSEWEEIKWSVWSSFGIGMHISTIVIY